MDESGEGIADITWSETIKLALRSTRT